jgi:hypothetical protein
VRNASAGDAQRLAFDLNDDLVRCAVGGKDDRDPCHPLAADHRSFDLVTLGRGGDHRAERRLGEVDELDGLVRHHERVALCQPYTRQVRLEERVILTRQRGQQAVAGGCLRGVAHGAPLSCLGAGARRLAAARALKVCKRYYHLTPVLHRLRAYPGQTCRRPGFRNWNLRGPVD